MSSCLTHITYLVKKNPIRTTTYIYTYAPYIHIGVVIIGRFLPQTKSDGLFESAREISGRNGLPSRSGLRTSAKENISENYFL